MDNAKVTLLTNVKVLHCAFDVLCALKEIKELVEKKERKRRSCSVRRVNRDRKRSGFFTTTFLKIKELSSEQFFKYTRMSSQIFGVLLNTLRPLLTKSSIREPVDPECRLAVLLLYLSQGTSLHSIARSFKLGRETVRKIVLETAGIVWKALFPLYVPEPNSKDLAKISSDFWMLWNMPNCLGSIDGKHIAIKCPPNSGSQYSSKDKNLSIVLLAVCDAKYRFTYVDVGAYGTQNNGGIFQLSRFGKRLLGTTVSIATPRKLPNTNVLIPHYFVGNASFPLDTSLMRPYSGTQLPAEKENFNSRLSRAQRTIENAFGILVSRWRILLTTLHMFPENAEKIVLACVALHNFVMANNETNSPPYFPHNYVDWDDSDGQLHNGLWRSDVGHNIPSIAPSSHTNHYGGRTSSEMRNILCDFLMKN